MIQGHFGDVYQLFTPTSVVSQFFGTFASDRDMARGLGGVVCPALL